MKSKVSHMGLQNAYFLLQAREIQLSKRYKTNGVDDFKAQLIIVLGVS